MTRDDTRRLNVLVSSPMFGLEEHREQAIQAILKCKMHPLAMEYLYSKDSTPREYSLDLVEDADIYIGFLAHRYGDCPPDSEMSYTEIEYRRAVEREIPKLIFLIDEHRAIQPEHFELDPVKYAKLQRFKSELNKHRYVIESFTDPMSLYYKIQMALLNQREELAKYPERWSVSWLAKGDLDPSTEHADHLNTLERELAPLKLGPASILELYHASAPPDFAIPEAWKLERGASGISTTATLHSALELLADARTLSGKVAPALEFAERAAANTSEATSATIRAYVDQIAPAWEVAPSALHALRQSLDQANVGNAKLARVESRAPTARLLIELDQDNGDPQLFLAQAWLFYGEGKQESVYETNQPRSFDKLPIVLSEVIRKVGRRGGVQLTTNAQLLIEFSLPCDFLSKDVDSCLFDDIAVGMEYLVVLRSLERLRNATWHPNWKAAWSRAMRLGPDDPGHIKWLGEGQNDHLDALFAEIVSSEMVSVAFTAPPIANTAHDHRHALHMAQRAGIPIIVWPHHAPESPEVASEIAATIQSLLDPQTLRDLPYHMLCARQKATQHAGSYLASRRFSLLWDDPTHIPPDLEDDAMLEAAMWR